MRVRLWIVGLIVLLVMGCSETKYVPEGKYLLDRVRIESDQKAVGVDVAQMRQFLRQRGNSRWLSAVRIPLATYSLSGNDTTKWINRTLRSMGEAPELFDSAMTELSAQDLRLQLQNLGYLRGTVSTHNTFKKKRARTTYVLHPREPYFIDQIAYDIQDPSIDSLLQASDSTILRGLQPGMMFNADNLDYERTRITKYLTNRGYYHFNKDFITFQADSIAGSNLIRLTLVLHRYRVGDVTNLPHPVYTIGDIQFHNGNEGGGELPLRPAVVKNNTFLNSGDLYSADNLQTTYNHFGRLGAVRYTNITFHERTEEPVLDCDIQLSTNKPSTLSFQPEGTNTAGDLGAAASLTYQNRNMMERFSEPWKMLRFW